MSTKLAVAVSLAVGILLATVTVAPAAATPASNTCAPPRTVCLWDQSGYAGELLPCRPLTRLLGRVSRWPSTTGAMGGPSPPATPAARSPASTRRMTARVPPTRSSPAAPTAPSTSHRRASTCTDGVSTGQPVRTLASDLPVSAADPAGVGGRALHLFFRSIRLWVDQRRRY